jgi:hypothetical protein
MSNSDMIEGDDIALFQLMALESSLLLETKGLKFSRGLSVYALIKKRYGFKGSKIRVLEQFNTMLNALRVERGLPEKALQHT